jgi:hypothetical protein
VPIFTGVARNGATSAIPAITLLKNL